METLPPRSGEAEDAASWLLLLDREGLSPIRIDGPTRVKNDAEAQIDFVASTVHLSYRFDIRKAWRPHLSDHAAIFADPVTARMRRRDDVLTPRMLQQFPADAFDDLRRRYAALEALFSVPSADLGHVATPVPWERPPPPGQLPQALLVTYGLTEPGASPASAASPLPVPRLPALLLYGHAALQQAILDWGRTWSRCRSQPGPLALLLRMCQASSPLMPVGVLADWLSARGWDSLPLTPTQARTWLGRWRYEAQQRRRNALHPAARGPDARRPPLPAQFRLGHELFRTSKAVQGVRDAQGQWQAHPAAMDTVLWAGRGPIWSTAPRFPITGGFLRRLYFLRRVPLTMASSPLPDWRHLAALVLAPKGSAPGIDGVPYEAYHHGARFVACLLGQAAYAAHDAPHLLTSVLGDSTELLVWIPKIPDPELPDHLRPLTLPPTGRRLYGAYCASILGPHIEPRLSPDQAAIRGGHCGPNITAVMAHLHSLPRPVPPPGPEWAAVLGPFLRVVEDYIARVVAELGPAPSTAVFFGDQNKAFERLSLQWLDAVLRDWAVPSWLYASLMALVGDRSVRFCRGSYRGPLRRMLRSVGMGGTASPLLWSIAYDPIISAASSVTGAPCPTYVDDLAALLCDTAQVLRLALFLPWASWLAGLQISTHECQGLLFPCSPEALDVAVDTLPIRVRTLPDGQSFVTGFPPPLLRELLAVVLPSALISTSALHEVPCTCALKTAVVPAWDLDWWRSLMAYSPFGASCVHASYPYLGATCACRGRGPAPPPHPDGLPPPQAPPQDDPALLATLRHGTWGKAVGKLGSRSRAMVASHSSAGRRAQLWNTYEASLVSYPSHVILMDDALEALARTSLAEAFGLGVPRWLHNPLVPGLGVLYQVPGAPRCLVSVARSVASLAYLRNDFWGPPPAVTEVRSLLARLWAWADAFPPDYPAARPRSRLPSLAAAAATARDIRDGRLPPSSPRAGPALYVAAWADQHMTSATAWLLDHSARRVWAPSVGGEWALLAAASSYTAAFHILRFLCNGLPALARRRPQALRPQHICSLCASPSSAVWVTSSPLGNGAEWCTRCLGPWASSTTKWALLDPSQVHPALHPLQASARLRHGPFPGHLAPLRSPFGVCPLCGFGEAGAEHLWTWCQAVALAWSYLRPDSSPPSFAEALLTPGPHTPFLAQFCHQIAYWFSIAVWTSPLTPERTLQLVRRSLHRSQQAGEELSDDDVEGPDVDRHPPEDLWARQSDACPSCLPQPAQLPPLRGSGRHSSSLHSDRIGTLTRSLHVRTPVPAATTLLVLRAESAHAGWLAPNRRWLPPPRVTTPSTATAEWRHRWCGQCRHFCASLCSRAALAEGVELTVPRPLTPGPDDGLWPLELTFDGGARCLGGRPKVAGGGAVLWSFPVDGTAPAPLASLVLALPQCDDSMLGEAHAGCQGLALLLSSLLPPVPRAVRVVGDNLPVVRFGAAAGRLRRVPQHAPLAETLGAVLAAGWRLTWNGVRRRFNEGADSLATLGVFWADALLSAGLPVAQAHVVWHTQNPPSLPPCFPPVPPSLALDAIRPPLDCLLAAAAAEARTARARGAH